MIGPIRGTRLPAEIKLHIIRAVENANAEGISVRRGCEVLMVSPRRLRRWIRGREVLALGEADLGDTPPVPRRRAHALLPSERQAIVTGAQGRPAGPPAPPQARPHLVPGGPGVLLGVLGPA